MQHGKETSVVNITRFSVERLMIFRTALEADGPIGVVAGLIPGAGSFPVVGEKTFHWVAPRLSSGSGG
jgi:hypothetical protein